MSNLISREGLLKSLAGRLMTDIFSDWVHLNDDIKAAACKVAGEIGKEIRNAPAVDAVCVTHCAKCVHSDRSPYGHPTILWCKLRGRHRNPDYFCADGIPRKEKE